MTEINFVIYVMKLQPGGAALSTESSLVFS